jgi:hypothetical protein
MKELMNNVINDGTRNRITISEGSASDDGKEISRRQNTIIVIKLNIVKTKTNK